LDTARLAHVLDGETAEEAEEPEAVLDRRPAHLAPPVAASAASAR
jgi:hypothetical protein